MLRVIAFSLVFGTAFIGGIFNPFIALLGYAWFALFRPQEWLWFDVSGWRFSFWLGILLLVRSALSGYLPNLTHRHSIAMVLVGLTAVIAHQGALRPDISLQWLDFFLRLIVVSLVAISLLDSTNRLYWFATTMALSFGFHTTKGGLASILGGGVHFYEGLGGAFIDNNSYAIGGVMVMPLLWAGGRLVPNAIPFRKAIRLFAYIAIPLTAFFVISTFSRSGFLALGAGLLLWFMLQRRKITSVLVISAALLAALPFVPMPEGYTERMETIQTFEEVQDSSAISRLHFWEVAMRMSADYPLGVGLFNFEPHYDDYDFSDGAYGRNRSVHSSYFQMLTETGFIGFALWIFLFISSIVLCIRVRSRSATPGLTPRDSDVLWTLATAFMVSLVSFSVGGIFISMALNDLTWLIFAAIAALDRVSQAKLEEVRRAPAMAA